MNLRGPSALGVSALAVVAATALGCALGSVPVPLGEVARALFGAPTANPDHAVIILELRLPRVLLGLVVGASLALAGAALQGLFRNPLADPYVLGVSSGAALGAVAALVWGGAATWLGLGRVPLAAFVGALSAALLVWRLASVGGALPVAGVLLAGVAVGLTLGAGVSLVLYFAEARAGDVVVWLMGHLGGTSATEVGWAAGCLALGGGAVLAAGRDLDLLALGEESAESLGVPVERLKLILLVATSVLVAGSVAFCGIIGFVGLVVPHVVRLVVGARHRWLLPVSALVGAATLALTDALARSVLPAGELPVGVVTGALGGPFFLVLLRRSMTHARA